MYCWGFVQFFQLVFLVSPSIIVLLMLAFMPLFAAKFWHKYEKHTLFSIAVLSLIATFSILDCAPNIVYDALIVDYLPFIITLFTLFVLSSGIYIKISVTPTTKNNVIFLFCGSILSSCIGTTGASMLLLPAFLKMNESRINRKHLIVFFIFLIANIGGILTPLGDPPLLLGYLKGIDFTWFFKNLYSIWLFYVISCLVILCVMDVIITKNEIFIKQENYFKINGFVNIILLLLAVIILFLQFNIVIKYIALLLLCCIAMFRNNNIDYSTFCEVAITFLVIFIVIAPVIFLLNYYSNVIQNNIIAVMQTGIKRESLFFWLCSIASSFLDNAPSFLIFFNMAGANAESLMYTNILKAIATSAVVMGSMTYIGNAPNMMIKTYSNKHGINMPSFLGYMAYTILIILPLSILANKLFW